MKRTSNRSEQRLFREEVLNSFRKKRRRFFAGIWEVQGSMKLSGEKMEGQERVEVLGATTTKLLRLGFQAQQIGYRYLREAVWVVCSDPEMITSVTKLLYPEIAKRFSTTDKQVERAIRNSIETAWVKGNQDAWKALAGQSIQDNATRPTNREMISLLAGSVSKES